MSRQVVFRAWNVKEKRWFLGTKDWNLIKRKCMSDLGAIRLSFSRFDSLKIICNINIKN